MSNKNSGFGQSAFFELKYKMERLVIVTQFELPNKAFLEQLMEREMYEGLFVILLNHYCLLELVFKIEKNMLPQKWSINDPLETKKNCVFVPTSENEFVIRMTVKNYFPHGVERRIKMEYSDSLTMKMARKKRELYFFGNYMDKPLAIFHTLMGEAFPGRIALKKNILRVKYTNADDLVEILESLVSLVLSFNQIYKTYVYVCIKAYKTISHAEPVQHVCSIAFHSNQRAKRAAAQSDAFDHVLRRVSGPAARQVRLLPESRM